MTNDEQPRKVQMVVVGTQCTDDGEFMLDMHAKQNAARIVRFSLVRDDAAVLYAALEQFLSKQ